MSLRKSHCSSLEKHVVCQGACILHSVDNNKANLLVWRGQETLRLYPPVGAGQVRLVNQGMTLHSGVEVPAGAIIWVPHHGLHTSSRNWDNSKEFIPGKTARSSVLYLLLAIILMHLLARREKVLQPQGVPHNKSILYTCSPSARPAFVNGI